MTKRGEVLVAIINNLNDFADLRDRHWYRIPVASGSFAMLIGISPSIVY